MTKKEYLCRSLTEEERLKYEIEDLKAENKRLARIIEFRDKKTKAKARFIT